jgi:glucosyl-dolichyl phosphate glucuronosyltransferase
MKSSVIVSTYSMDLVSDTLTCIDSLRTQDYPEKEILLVLDENEELYNLYYRTLQESVKIVINRKPGLSEARNTGILNATGDVIVFIDDDAVAGKHFLSNLMKNYDDSKVIGAGGRILPNGTPVYPEELYWIGGFTYKGYPEKRSFVRNVHGCNMSFRKCVFDRVGLFNTHLGRIGKKLITAEETEFSLRALQKFPKSHIVYDPSSTVTHKVHEYRQNLRYGIKRGYYEGLAKASISNHFGSTLTISHEAHYFRYLFTTATLFQVRTFFHGNIKALNNVIWFFIIGVGVGIGYIRGKIGSF